MTDRGFWVTLSALDLNVRRLMYQSLILRGMLGNEPSRLRTPLNAEDLKRLPNSLVDRMRRDPKLGSDFLRAHMLIDETEAVELAVA
jgi:hypothetical protein